MMPADRDAQPDAMMAILTGDHSAFAAPLRVV